MPLFGQVVIVLSLILIVALVVFWFDLRKINKAIREQAKKRELQEAIHFSAPIGDHEFLEPFFQYDITD